MFPTIVTWNMQGGATKWCAIPALYNNQTLQPPLICCLQEVTKPPDKAEFCLETEGVGWYTWDQGECPNRFGSTLYIGFKEWMLKSPGNPRCSLAIVSNLEPAGYYPVLSGEKTYRPLLAATFYQFNFQICSIHAKAWGGINTRMDIQGLLDGIDVYEDSMPTLIAGDFNVQPEALELHLNTMPWWKVIALKKNTLKTHEKGGKLDYIVTNISNVVRHKQNLEDTHSWRGTYKSDHAAQAFEVTQEKRQLIETDPELGRGKRKRTSTITYRNMRRKTNEE